MTEEPDTGRAGPELRHLTATELEVLELGARASDKATITFHGDQLRVLLAAYRQHAALLDLWEAAIGTVARIDAAADQGFDVSPDPALADLLRGPLAALQASRDSTPDPLE